MFYHSVSVPRLYKIAAKIAKTAKEGNQSLKQLVYEGRHPNKKALFSLVIETFRRARQLDILFKKSKLLINEPRFDCWLAKILVTELLWGKKVLLGQSTPVKKILSYEQMFKAHLSDLNINPSPLPKITVKKPRYIRINTIAMPTNEAIACFQEEDWILVPYNNRNNYPTFLDKIKNLNHNEFMIDFHIPDLLVFPYKTEFHKHRAYLNGTILLQDKASCIPVEILNPEPGSIVLDMCAAPGMKATHIATKLNNHGTIYAVEFDEKRFKTLNSFVESTGTSCIKTINRDVLTVTGSDCPEVEYILVDPSCSGSGITDRIELDEDRKEITKERLKKLAGFQIKMLRHALNQFPKVKRVVYSTCSIYSEENEDVVRQVLETCTKFKLVPANQFINNWLHYGSEEFGDIGRFCLYTKPEIDLTNGFFVAVFERLKDGESNEFFNRELLKFNKKNQNKRFNQNKEYENGQRNENSGNMEEICENDNPNHELTFHEKNEIFYVNKLKKNSGDDAKNENKRGKKRFLSFENCDNSIASVKKICKMSKNGKELITQVEQTEAHCHKVNNESKAKKNKTKKKEKLILTEYEFEEQIHPVENKHNKRICDDELIKNKGENQLTCETTESNLKKVKHEKGKKRLEETTNIIKNQIISNKKKKKKSSKKSEFKVYENQTENYHNLKLKITKEEGIRKKKKKHLEDIKDKNNILSVQNEKIDKEIYIANSNVNEKTEKKKKEKNI